jgi:hypothetical protein
VTIGTGSADGEIFNGQIDEPAIYNRVLTDEEIAAIYAAGASGKCLVPTSPTIVAQPESRTVALGDSVGFSVVASGTAPLTYQWSFNGAPIVGATNALFSIASAQESNTGSYFVSVTNAHGVAISSNAFLLVQPVPACAPVPIGLVAWWPMNGDGTDLAWMHPATILPGTQFAPGKVGSAASMSGAGGLRVPASTALDVGAGAGLTAEAWVSCPDTTPGQPIFDWADERYGYAVHLFVNYPNPGNLQACFTDTAGVLHAFETSSRPLTNGVFQHVAMSYDRSSGVGRIYVNGQIAAEAMLGMFIPRTASDLHIGHRPAGTPFGPIWFTGMIDEPAVYRRALSPAEIAAIYGAGASGKCNVPMAPTIVEQPESRTVVAGERVEFSVIAAGTPPFRYQWYFNGALVSGGTNQLFSIAGAQEANAGSYFVLVSNSVGVAVSSNAVLQVQPLPTCSPVPAGILAWWRGDGNSLDTLGVNTGQAHGGVSFDPARVGDGFKLNGSGSFVEVPDRPLFDLTNEITVELWFKYTGPAGGYYGIIAKRALYPGGCNFGINVMPGNQLQVYFRDRYLDSYQVSALPTPLAEGVFHHIAAVYRQHSAAEVEVLTYTDGSLANREFLPGNLANGVNDVPITIGADTPNHGHFTGMIDEVGIYARALTAAELGAIYAAGASGKCLEPTRPIIVAQPESRTVAAGKSVSFSVVAAGTAPLTYQWSFNGALIVGATNTLLTIASAQESNAGSYFVSVSNSVGFAVSSNAVLTVMPASPCAPPPAGIVAWWPGEGDLNDVIGGNNGSGTFSYAEGMVGQAFAVQPGAPAPSIPSTPALNPRGPLTLETWVKILAHSDNDTVLIAGKESDSQRQYALSVGRPYGPWLMRATLGTTNGVAYLQGTSAVQVGQWYHTAMTYDGSMVKLYVNGVLESSQIIGGSVKTSTEDFHIGGYNNGPWTMNGLVDEPSLYHRALTEYEILAIYNAGFSGKCVEQRAPEIVFQPESRTVTVGEPVAFSVGVIGAWPLRYQWHFNGAPIANATNSVLQFVAVQKSDAGTYTVVVSNALGSATSAEAKLTVNPGPVQVRIMSVDAPPAGTKVVVPIVAVANGQESAFGFSVSYGSQFGAPRLSFIEAELGAATTEGSLLVNTSETNLNRVGVTFALPGGTTLTAGTQEVARLLFRTLPSPIEGSALLSFGDAPTRREISDPQALVLPASYGGGVVMIPASIYEADVAPRPSGDRSVSVIDWVQVGRFVSHLDAATNATEFQRADCAPRQNSGDGAISLADWVQAGRYAAGLDPLQVLDGPQSPASKSWTPPIAQGPFLGR